MAERGDVGTDDGEKCGSLGSEPLQLVGRHGGMVESRGWAVVWEQGRMENDGWNDEQRKQ